jgi:hypothetical protein
MKFSFLVILLILIFGTSLTSLAQFTDEVDVKRNIKIGLVPHYLIFNGLRFDVEKQIIEGKSIILAPEIYFRQNQEEANTGENELNTLYGCGLDIYRKYFFKTANVSYCYFAYGVNYSFFDVYFQEYVWELTTQNNLEALRWNLKKLHEQIHRGGANLIVGIDNDINDLLYFDIYVGLGLKYSYSILPDGIKSTKFNNFMTNYAYSGTVFTSGFKIGFKL